MRKYIVSTHIGDFPTMAPSPQKAINNVRWRIFGRGFGEIRYVHSWTVREA